VPNTCCSKPLHRICADPCRNTPMTLCVTYRVKDSVGPLPNYQRHSTPQHHYESKDIIQKRQCNPMHMDRSGNPCHLPFAAGAIGSTIANPTDLVKIRLQAEGRLEPGAVRRHHGVLHAFRDIYRQEGMRGLWTGCGPSIFRAMVLTATQVATHLHLEPRASPIPVLSSSLNHGA